MLRLCAECYFGCFLQTRYIVAFSLPLTSWYFLTSPESSSVTRGLCISVLFHFQVFAEFVDAASLFSASLIPLWLRNTLREISITFNLGWV